MLGNVNSEYGVDPLIYAIIYIASLPLFYFSFYKIVKIWKQGGEGRGYPKPLILKGLFFWGAVIVLDYVSPYLYIMFFGKNFPTWVYYLLGFLGILLIYLLFLSIKKRVKAEERNSTNIWDKMAKSFHTTSSRSKAHRNKYEIVSRLIMESRPTNILDLGCGSGILEKVIIDAGYAGKILAIDGSSVMLEIGRELVSNEQVSFEKANLDSDIEGTELFDVIVSINLIFMLKDKQKFLRTVRNHLKTEASTFYLVTPKPSNMTSNWEFVKEHYADTNFWEKVLITLNTLSVIPSAIRMALQQGNITKLEKSGEIVFHNSEEISVMAKSVGFEVLEVRDIHAKQNWLFILKRGI